MTITYKGTEYALATTLRVAYKVQGQHNHKPYMSIFQDITDLQIEHQIGILYAAFQVGNPIEASKVTQKDFQDYYLDNYTLREVMEQMKSVINGILGMEEAPDSDEDAELVGDESVGK